MWQLQNRTPFAAERAFVRDKNGAETWVVAVKATFTIHSDGLTTLAEQQAAVCMAPQYRGDPLKSSLLYESDLVHTKPGTDILLHGHAYASSGKQALWVQVEMQVGSLIKRLQVFGNRYWEKSFLNLKITPPEPFAQMPIVYERAFGGVDEQASTPTQRFLEERNPVGLGFAVKAEHLIEHPVANVEDPAHLITSWKQRPQPVGFGPLARHWLPRRQFAGTYDTKWEQTRQPLLPEDFDERFYACAPPDQQVSGYLKGGEPVVLYNLSPNSSVLHFQIPSQSPPRFKTWLGNNIVEHEAKLHTVILEPDVPQVSLVWQTHLNCHNRDTQLEKTLIF